MKKVFLVLLANLFLLACSKNEELVVAKDNPSTCASTSRLVAGENVKLIKAKDTKQINCITKGCHTTQSREYVAEVSNLGYSKVVVVHQQLNNGEWEDISLFYSFTTNTGTEIWKGASTKDVFTSVIPTRSEFGDKITVKYVVNGQTYWDNNSNKDYILLNTNRQENSSFLYLNPEFSIFNTTTSATPLVTNTDVSCLNVAADVRNLGFVKDVKVVYTTNNWATTSSATLTFNAAENKNETKDFEIWTAAVLIPKTTKVTYALSYKSNGQTYWDNNFGKNYTVTSD
jgi:hypothetical protein